MAPRVWQSIDGPSGPLALHMAGAEASGANVALLLHDFPVEPDSAKRTGRSLPALADRLASESKWRVVAGCMRGVGLSAGEFSLAGWMDDLHALTAHAQTQGAGVWIVGFGVSGSLGLCAAVDDPRVRGVACLGSPATFADWAGDPRSMLSAARQVGVLGSGAEPDGGIDRWAHEFTAVDPLKAARLLGGRPVLVVHGLEDDEVPVADARLLADALGPAAELRILTGAGHRLRADPRAMALLIGWLERQGP
ncbi:MAG: alpha/beta hydrolase [Acidimicrobiales bacterium]